MSLRHSTRRTIASNEGQWRCYEWSIFEPQNWTEPLGEPLGSTQRQTPVFVTAAPDLELPSTQLNLFPGSSNIGDGGDSFAGPQRPGDWQSLMQILVQG